MLVRGGVEAGEAGFILAVFATYSPASFVGFFCSSFFLLFNFCRTLDETSEKELNL